MIQAGPGLSRGSLNVKEGGSRVIHMRKTHWPWLTLNMKELTGVGCGQALETGSGKDTDDFLEPPDRNAALPTPRFGASGLQKREAVSFYCFQPSTWW